MTKQVLWQYYVLLCTVRKHSIGPVLRQGLSAVSKWRSEAAPCWPQLLKPAPVNTSQDMAVFCHAASVSGNTCFKKSRKSHKMRRSSIKRGRSSTGKKQGQTRRRRSSTAEQKFPEDHGKSRLEQVYPEELKSMKSTHTGAWEQREEEGAAGWELDCCVLTAAPSVQLRVE